jgi:hypothetical protein
MVQVFLSAGRAVEIRVNVITSTKRRRADVIHRETKPLGAPVAEYGIVLVKDAAGKERCSAWLTRSSGLSWFTGQARRSTLARASSTTPASKGTMR